MDKDSKGNWYEEVPIPGSVVRITYVTEGWAGTPSVRIQTKDEDRGNLRQGPEVPLSAVGGLVGAIVELLSRHS